MRHPVRLGPPGARRQLRLLAALLIDALGSGLFLPFSVLFFAATTRLSLLQIGTALSVAALVRAPATIGAGALTDRAGARATVVVSQLLQAFGFAGYLFVNSVGYLVLAASLVQLGNSTFWVGYQALVAQVAEASEGEAWFALCAALRTAGLALGGLLASVSLALQGHRGYDVIVIANAGSFLIAAALTIRRPARASQNRNHAASEPASGWLITLRDKPFLGFVALNFGFTLLSLAFALALPVYLVRSLHLPPWTPGIMLAVNAVLATVGVPPALAGLTGRRRYRMLLVSQLSIAAGFGVLLCASPLSARMALPVVLLGVVLVTTCEVIQGAIVPAVVSDAAPPRAIGRYLSLYQLTFAVGDVVVPVVVTLGLTGGPAMLWLPLIGVALLDLAGIALAAQALAPLRAVVGGRPQHAQTVS